VITAAKPLVQQQQAKLNGSLAPWSLMMSLQQHRTTQQAYAQNSQHEIFLNEQVELVNGVLAASPDLASCYRTNFCLYAVAKNNTHSLNKTTTLILKARFVLIPKAWWSVYYSVFF